MLLRLLAVGQQLRRAHFDNRLRILNYALGKVILYARIGDCGQYERVQQHSLSLLRDRVDDVSANIVERQISSLLDFQVHFDYVPPARDVVFNRFGDLPGTH